MQVTRHVLLLILSVESKEYWSKTFLFPWALFRYSISSNIFLSTSLSMVMMDFYLGSSQPVYPWLTNLHWQPGYVWMVMEEIEPRGEDSYFYSLSASIEHALMVVPLRLGEVGTSYVSGILDTLSFRVEGWHLSSTSWDNKLQSTQINFLFQQSFMVSDVSGERLVLQIQWTCVCGHRNIPTLPMDPGPRQWYEINARICFTFENNFWVISEANR